MNRASSLELAAYDHLATIHIDYVLLSLILHLYIDHTIFGLMSRIKYMQFYICHMHNYILIINLYKKNLS